jgi:hypothetical protein
MPNGRPKELPFDPDENDSVRQSTVNLDDRGRLKIPAKIIDGASWLVGRETLAVLTAPGLIRLHPWESAGLAVLDRRRELAERAKVEPSTFEVLRALEDRYKRFSIPRSVRPTLTNEMILHLGLTPSVPTSIYVWRIADTVELNSSIHRIQHLRDDWEELGDLP